MIASRWLLCRKLFSYQDKGKHGLVNIRYTPLKILQKHHVVVAVDVDVDVMIDVDVVVVDDDDDDVVVVAVVVVVACIKKKERTDLRISKFSKF